MQEEGWPACPGLFAGTNKELAVRFWGKFSVRTWSRLGSRNVLSAALSLSREALQGSASLPTVLAWQKIIWS